MSKYKDVYGVMQIELPVYGIRLSYHLDSNAGGIWDNLHEELDYDNQDEVFSAKETYNDMIDGITSMILGHACAGIDVESPAYLEGIETAVENCCSQLP